MKKTLTILAISLAYMSAAAQSYTDVDKWVENTPIKEKKLDKVVSTLCAPFGADSLKAHAIFKWITLNIEYDMYTHQRIEVGKKTRRKQKPHQVFRRKKALNYGYALLFESMATKAGLQAVTIRGVAKSKISEIGKNQTKINHAWNAVTIGKRHALLDVAWASGGTINGKFVKNFKEYYFDTPAPKFVVNHFPKEKAWQLLDTPISYSDFKNYPIPYDAFFKNNFVLTSVSKIGRQDVMENTPSELPLILKKYAGKPRIYAVLQDTKRKKSKKTEIKKVVLAQKTDYESDTLTIELQINTLKHHEMVLSFDTVPLLGYKLKVKPSIPSRLDKSDPTKSKKKP